MLLTWHTDEWPSALHAAAALERGLRLVDARLAQALAPPRVALCSALAALGVHPERFWQHALELSCGAPSASELTQAALAKIMPAHQSGAADLQPLALAMAELQSAMGRCLPNLRDELSLRSGPLQEAWNARGPGLLRCMARLTGVASLPPKASVLCVYPVLGGAGRALIPYHAVTIEAVLANPHPQLPEAARLGWLLGQLNMSLPRAADWIDQQRWEHTAAVALIPAALTAAEEVELACCNERTLREALVHWHLASEGEATALAGRLDRWWQAYRQQPANFCLAIEQLSTGY